MNKNSFLSCGNAFIAMLFLVLVVFGQKLFASNHNTEFVIKPFNETSVCFNTNDYPDKVWEEDGLIRLDHGRIVLKKIRVPKFKQNIVISAKVKLTSNGDRWDKSGSCFVIPASSVINLIEVAAGRAKYPDVDSTKLEHFKGIVPGENFSPNVELMRFMTPFGVGYFSKMDSVTAERRKPVYIDEFAPYAEWEQNITDLYPLLKDDVYVGAFIDTWTKDGYKISLELDFKESTLKCDKLPKRKVLPLVNTVYYYGQSIPDLFARKSLSIPFTLPKNAKNIRLNYITTGHGGHDGGDEFVKKENIVSIDGHEVICFIPWRNDCASFRRFNPSTGVWLQKRTASYISEEGKRAEKEIEEPIASSDLSRSNWCPGSVVAPYSVLLENLSPGDHILNIAIPKAQASEGDKMNHWLVSAYIVWDE